MEGFTLENALQLSLEKNKEYLAKALSLKAFAEQKNNENKILKEKLALANERINSLEAELKLHKGQVTKEVSMHPVVKSFETMITRNICQYGYKCIFHKQSKCTRRFHSMYEGKLTEDEKSKLRYWQTKLIQYENSLSETSNFDHTLDIKSFETMISYNICPYGNKCIFHKEGKCTFRFHAVYDSKLNEEEKADQQYWHSELI